MKTQENLVLAVDIGTTAMKGGLVNHRGELTAYHRVTYWEKTKQDYQSWDPQVWIDSLRDIVASLGGYERITAVTISGHGPTLIPVDSQGAGLYFALLWLDKRALPRAGTRSFYLPKIAWLKDHHPELYHKTRWFLSCPEYLNFFLTGQAFTITPSDEFSPYIWQPEDCRTYDLDPGKLPPFATMGQLIGQVTETASLQTGIRPGIPVVAGGADFLLALVGSGTVEPGRVCDRAGTSEGINYCHGISLKHPGIRTLPHGIPGLYNLSGILSSTGRLFEWVRRITGQTDRTYREILQDIQNLPLDRSRPFFFPSMETGGDFEFARGGFLELHPDHTREDLGRAVIESIGFGIHRILLNLDQMGLETQEIRVTGGQARNVIWNQMKADITGKRILVPEIEDAELLGGACAALVGLGVYPSLKDAALKLVRLKAVFNPRSERHKIYQDLYHQYQDYQAQTLQVPLQI